MGQFFDGWVASEAQDHDAIKVKRLYVDINEGNWYDAALFSQIMYWHGRSKETGERRMKVFRDNEFWVAKRYEDWWAECRVNAETAKKAIVRMVKRGLLIKQVWLFNGKPMVHLRVNIDGFEVLANHCIEEAKDFELNRSNVPDAKGTIDQMDQVLDTRLYTETTTETTTEVEVAPSEPPPVLIESTHVPFHMAHGLGIVSHTVESTSAREVREHAVFKAFERGWDDLTPAVPEHLTAIYKTELFALQAEIDKGRYTLDDVEGVTRAQLKKPRAYDYRVTMLRTDMPGYLATQRALKGKQKSLGVIEDNAVPDDWGVDSFMRKPAQKVDAA